MMSLTHTIIRNLITEREIAYAKRGANIRANLPHDKLDARIAHLSSEIDKLKATTGSAK